MPNKRGRPPVPVEDRRDLWIKIRVNQAEKEAFDSLKDGSEMVRKFITNCKYCGDITICTCDDDKFDA